MTDDQRAELRRLLADLRHARARLAELLEHLERRKAKR